MSVSTLMTGFVLQGHTLHLPHIYDSRWIYLRISACLIVCNNNTCCCRSVTGSHECCCPPVIFLTGTASRGTVPLTETTPWPYDLSDQIMTSDDITAVLQKRTSAVCLWYSLRSFFNTSWVQSRTRCQRLHVNGFQWHLWIIFIFLTQIFTSDDDHDGSSVFFMKWFECPDISKVVHAFC